MTTYNKDNLSSNSFFTMYENLRIEVFHESIDSLYFYLLFINVTSILLMCSSSFTLEVAPEFPNNVLKGQTEGPTATKKRNEKQQFKIGRE